MNHDNVQRLVLLIILLFDYTIVPECISDLCNYFSYSSGMVILLPQIFSRRLYLVLHPNSDHDYDVPSLGAVRPSSAKCDEART